MLFRNRRWVGRRKRRRLLTEDQEWHADTQPDVGEVRNAVKGRQDKARRIVESEAAEVGSCPVSWRTGEGRRLSVGLGDGSWPGCATSKCGEVLESCTGSVMRQSTRRSSRRR